MASGGANRDVVVPNALDTKCKLAAMNKMLFVSGDSPVFGRGNRWRRGSGRS
jgi:hypothetical protein